jgi:hypothetical protein
VYQWPGNIGCYFRANILRHVLVVVDLHDSCKVAAFIAIIGRGKQRDNFLVMMAGVTLSLE